MAPLLYMHTIDGRPATFDGEQICFVDVLPHWEDLPYPAELRTRSQIIHDQNRSYAFRKRHRLGDPGEYGHILVVPR